MCGICGCLYNESSELDSKIIVDSIISNLKHRGPEGIGTHIDKQKKLALGHTRLSIFDISLRGKQPMHYMDRFSITFNGAIYNFIELRDKLIGKGYHFKSKSDTEVILAAFAEWGRECVHQFNGMWAFAIWDKLEDVLFLSRDRFGIKPLYYMFSKEKSFVFASEIHALKKSPFFDFTLSKENILTLIHEPSCLDPVGLTPYKDLHLLPAGHSLTLDKRLKSVRLQKWWNLSENEIDYSKQEIETEFDFLLNDSCKIRLRSDAFLASALSGGLDSSSIYATVNRMDTGANRFCPGNHRSCFNMRFDDSFDSEHKFAKLVALHFQQSCNFTSLSLENLWSDLSFVTPHFADFSGTPLTCISPLYECISREGIKVSLDGHGGDECLMGYPDMISAAIEISPSEEKRNLQLTLNEMLRNPAYSNKHHIPISAKARIALGKAKRLFRMGSNSKVPSLITHTPSYTIGKEDFRVPDLVKDYRERKREMKKSFFGIHQAALELERLPLILRNFDKASMLSGVEIRTPFLDYRLVEFCCNLPMRHKVHKGYTKYLLRKTMDKHLPNEITWRKHKIGINAPLDLWMQNQTFEASYREQLEGNAPWISEMLEITKPTESLFDATKGDLSLNWFLLNLSFLKN